MNVVKVSGVGVRVQGFGFTLELVPRGQKMLKRHLPRVMYRQVSNLAES